MKKIQGISLSVIIAVCAWFIGQQVPIIGAPIIAMVLGMLIGKCLKDKTVYQEGLRFASKKLLQISVICLGFGLSLQTVFEVGKEALPVILISVTSALLGAYVIGRLLKLPYKTVVLVGVGSSICGGSAIAAVSPVVDADDESIAQSMSVIFLFNLLAAFLFVPFGSFLNMSHEIFAIFTGTAVNDTSSVTAVASSWDALYQTGHYVLDLSTIVKLTRTLAIVPIVFGLSWIQKQRGNGDNVKAPLPTFIIYFLLASALTSVVGYLGDMKWIEQPVLHVFTTLFGLLKNISKFLIVIVMAAIGINTDPVQLVSKGKKTLLLGLFCWVCVIISTLILLFIKFQ